MDFMPIFRLEIGLHMWIKNYVQLRVLLPDLPQSSIDQFTLMSHVRENLFITQ